MKSISLRPGRALQARAPDGLAVKIIGLGGVGSIVARYGAIFLASLHEEIRLVLLDGDAFELSNSTRMLFSRCGNKAAVMLDELRPRFGETNLSLIAIEEFISPENVSRLVQTGDVCLLCVDNHATRKLLDDHCAELSDVCLISGGNDGVGPDSSGAIRRGTYGNVQVFIRRRGRNQTPPLSRHHPEIARPADHLPSDQSCTELMASTPQILFANLAVASAMLNTLWLYLCGSLHYSEAAFDIAEALMRPAAGLRQFCGLPRPPVRTGSAPTRG